MSILATLTKNVEALLPLDRERMQPRLNEAVRQANVLKMLADHALHLPCNRTVVAFQAAAENYEFHVMTLMTDMVPLMDRADPACETLRYVGKHVMRAHSLDCFIDGFSGRL